VVYLHDCPPFAVEDICVASTGKKQPTPSRCQHHFYMPRRGISRDKLPAHEGSRYSRLCRPQAFLTQAKHSLDKRGGEAIINDEKGLRIPPQTHGLLLDLHGRHSRPHSPEGKPLYGSRQSLRSLAAATKHALPPAQPRSVIAQAQQSPAKTPLLHMPERAQIQHKAPPSPSPLSPDRCYTTLGSAIQHAARKRGNGSAPSHPIPFRKDVREGKSG
jgi:hypothetical protein